MVKLLTFEEPLFLLLIIPILLSSLTTSSRCLYILNLLVVLTFSWAFLYHDSSYFDTWFLIIIVVFIIIYHSKDRIREIIKSHERTILTGIEKYVYDRDFRLLFSEEDFKIFISIAQIMKTKDKFELAVEGERIDKLIYIAIIPSYKSAILKAKDTVISYLHEGAWLGVVEFILHYSNAEKTNNPNESENKWLVSLSLENGNTELVYYEWDFVSLTNLFKYSNDYLFINKILFIWIKYMSNSLIKMDDHIANALKAVRDHDQKAKENTLPLSK